MQGKPHYCTCLKMTDWDNMSLHYIPVSLYPLFCNTRKSISSLSYAAVSVTCSANITKIKVQYNSIQFTYKHRAWWKTYQELGLKACFSVEMWFMLFVWFFLLERALVMAQQGGLLRGMLKARWNNGVMGWVSTQKLLRIEGGERVNNSLDILPSLDCMKHKGALHVTLVT